MKSKLFSRTCSCLSRAARLHRLRDVAIALIMLALCFPVLAQTQWIKYNNNPVLSGGPASTWDGGRIFYHIILFDGTQYRMWYTGYNPNLSAKPAIGYATSPDGINWTKYANNPILTPNPTGFEEDGLFEPVVIFDGARYQMWYDGSSQSESVFATGYATSPDGINWTKHSGNPVLQRGPAGSWDDQGAFPSTVRFDGSNYRMWYTGFDGEVARFGHATSSDGIHWSKYLGNPILNIGPAGAWDSVFLWLPDVHFDGTIYHMWYAGFGPATGGIGHATSFDGLDWNKDPANPILSPGAPGTWESEGVGDPRVLFEGNKYKMWYTGVDAQINVRIGYAIYDPTTAVTDVESEFITTEYTLNQNYPNPFNPSTTIRYALPREARGVVTLKIFNVQGQELATLVHEKQVAGEHAISWNAAGLPSGVYLYRLQAGDWVETRKMILAK